VLDLQIEIGSGQLYGGILDIAKNEFIVQQQLQSGSTQVQFALTEDRLIDVIVRQGPDDTPVKAIYRYGQLRVLAGIEEAPVGESAEENPEVTPVVRPPETPDTISESEETAPQGSGLDSEKSGIPGLYKPGRIYCPMVYTTLSVFQHSLDISICCYMANVPGERRSNLKEMPVLQGYNADGFKLVRRTLNTDQHLPVCDSCPYGASRS
jgi:hypothetical protein